MTKPDNSDDSATAGKPNDSARPYIIGFLLSVALTLAAYLLVTNQILSGWGLAYAIVGLAIAQLAVQLIYFLHLGHESEPRWNVLLLDFTMIIIVIVVIGSLWIMNNLHYNMNPSPDQSPSPQQLEQELLEDEGIRRPDRDNQP